MLDSCIFKLYNIKEKDIKNYFLMPYCSKKYLKALNIYKLPSLLAIFKSLSLFFSKKNLKNLKFIWYSWLLIYKIYKSLFKKIINKNNKVFFLAMRYCLYSSIHIEIYEFQVFSFTSFIFCWKSVTIYFLQIHTLQNSNFECFSKPRRVIFSFLRVIFWSSIVKMTMLLMPKINFIHCLFCLYKK